MSADNQQGQRQQAGHFVTSNATGRMGCVVEVTPDGYVVKFAGSRRTTFVRTDDVTPDRRGFRG